MVRREDLRLLIEQGENSSVEFKRDDIRPEQLAREAAALANAHGGVILLGVEDDGEVSGIRRPSLESWVMDTVFGRYLHPLLIPHYQEIRWDGEKRVAVLTISPGAAKPYVVRHNDREDVYVRVGSTTRLATREQNLRLFGAGGLLHTEMLPVSGTTPAHLDRARVENYLRVILGEPVMPASEAAWLERLDGLGFLVAGPLGEPVCTVAGLLLFGIRPRRHLPQAGLRVMVFAVPDKQYQALLDVVLDGPLVGRWSNESGGARTLIDEGLVERFVRTIEPFITVEPNQIDQGFRRERLWLYPVEALRETVLNALVHRDYTRAVDIEVTRYSDRLEVISPGALPNSMTVEKMKAGRRTPRNPMLLEVMRDYGYVDARGMGVRTKVIPFTRRLAGVDPHFAATDDALTTVIPVGPVPDHVPDHVPDPGPHLVAESAPPYAVEAHILALIQANPAITYDELARQTGRNRKTIQRHLSALKAAGRLRRIGSDRTGHWERVES